MNITTLANSKTIVSGGVATGKTTFLQNLVRNLPKTQKVVVGYVKKDDNRGTKGKEALTWMSEQYPYLGTKIKENIHPVCLTGEIKGETFEEHLKIFVGNAVKEGAVCVLDGLDTYAGNEEIFRWLFEIQGNIIVSIQGVGKFAPEPIQNLLKKADNIVVLGKVTKYNNIQMYQELGFDKNKVHFFSKRVPSFIAESDAFAS